MVSVDIKQLLSRLNPLCTRALEAAAGHCVSRTHYEVTVEHVFSKLLEDPRSDLAQALRHFDIEPGSVKKSVDQTIEELRTGNSGKPVFSPVLLEWFQESWLVASINLGQNRIRSGALLLGLLTWPTRFAVGDYMSLLQSIGKESLQTQFGKILKDTDEGVAAEFQPAGEEGPPGEQTALGRFCTDFTEKARAHEIDPVFGRDTEIHQMIDILARRRKNNPIVVGEAGVGKTAVVEGLALRVVDDDVPEILKGVSILGLDMGLLQAGAGVKGEFENRLKSVINEIKASPKPIILFIDEAHTLIGAGGPSGGSDAANLLKPALARGELRTIAATTWSEYKKYFEKDAALARRFQLVKLDEPSVDTAVLILRGLKSTYEEAHGVVVRDDAIVAAAELSSRYLSGRQLPDKAVDLLDTSGARVKILLSAKPDAIEDRERTVQALEREKRALDRDRLHGMDVEEDRVKELDERIGTLNREIEELEERWRKEQELAKNVIALRKERYDLSVKGGSDGKETELRDRINAFLQELAELQGDSPLIRTEVDPDIVSKVVSDWTGIPLGKVKRDEALSVVNLEDNLRLRIKGSRPCGPAAAYGHFPHGGTERRRQDGNRAFRCRSPLRRRAVHGYHQHERVSGVAHGEPSDRLSSGIRRVWRGRHSHRGGPSAALFCGSARRGRKGAYGCDESLLSGIRQGHAFRRRGPGYRFQEHHSLPHE